MEKQNSDSWFKKIAGVFVELPDTEPIVQPTTVANAAAAPQANPSLEEELTARFQKVMADKNQAGFDFFEFSQMLLRSSANPSADQYRTAFEGGKMLNPQCSKEFLVKSAAFYKTELTAAFQSTSQIGLQKKAELNQKKANEKQTLDASVQKLTQQITDLQKQLATAEQQLHEQQQALGQIDQKYVALEAEIDSKLHAANAAKDGVLAQIQTIETGINQYI